METSELDIFLVSDEYQGIWVNMAGGVAKRVGMDSFRRGSTTPLVDSILFCVQINTKSSQNTLNVGKWFWFLVQHIRNSMMLLCPYKSTVEPTAKQQHLDL